MSYLYAFIDESGNYDFSPKGTKHWVVTSLLTKSIDQGVLDLYHLKHQLIDLGTDLEKFHASEDRQAVRDMVFPIISALDDVRVDVRRFLRSSVPKIVANLKFEERWSREFFRTGVKNWAYDTMLSTHFGDNRQGITGLKFQAFVQFGVEPYDEEISPYLKSEPNQLNRIAEVPMHKILQYGAMDAKLTWMLWECRLC